MKLKYAKLFVAVASPSMAEEGGGELIQKKENYRGNRKPILGWWEYSIIYIEVAETAWNWVLKMDAFDLCKLHFYICLFFNMAVILESWEGPRWFFGFVFRWGHRGAERPMAVVAGCKAGLDSSVKTSTSSKSLHSWTTGLKINFLLNGDGKWSPWFRRGLQTLSGAPLGRQHAPLGDCAKDFVLKSSSSVVFSAVVSSRGPQDHTHLPFFVESGPPRQVCEHAQHAFIS